MNKLKLILESINSNDLVKALKLCNEYEKEESTNKHLINNFKGVINFLEGNLDLAENSFLKLRAFSKFTMSPMCPPISSEFIELIFSAFIFNPLSEEDINQLKKASGTSSG